MSLRVVGQQYAGRKGEVAVCWRLPAVAIRRPKSPGGYFQRNWMHSADRVFLPVG